MLKIQSKYVLKLGLKSSNYYSISSRNSYSILQIAKMFESDIKFLPKIGERYASALTKMSFTNRLILDLVK